MLGKTFYSSLVVAFGNTAVLVVMALPDVVVVDVIWGAVVEVDCVDVEVVEVKVDVVEVAKL